MRWTAMCAIVTTLLGSAPVQAAEPDPAASLVYFDMAGNETLDPAEPRNNSRHSHEGLLAIYETIIRLAGADPPGPGLAASWARNADLTDLTLKLRPGVFFHDGEPVNAEAVCENFERGAALGRRAGGTTFETFNLSWIWFRICRRAATDSMMFIS